MPRYVHEWIIDIEEITPLAHDIRDAVRVGAPLPEVPEECVYEVDEDVRQKLGMDSLMKGIRQR